MKITVNNESEPLMIESKSLRNGENDRAEAPSSLVTTGADGKKSSMTTATAKTPDEEGSKLLAMFDKSDRKSSAISNTVGISGGSGPAAMHPAATAIIDPSKPRNSSFGGTTGNELTVYSSSIPSSSVKPGTEVLTLISTWIKSAPNDFMGMIIILFLIRFRLIMNESGELTGYVMCLLLVYRLSSVGRDQAFF